MTGPFVTLPFILSLMAFGVCYAPAEQVPFAPPAQIQMAASDGYLDVKEEAGYRPAVEYMTALGVLSPSGRAPRPGVGQPLFSPEGKVDGDDVITALYRLSRTGEEGTAALLPEGREKGTRMERTARLLNCWRTAENREDDREDAAVWAEQAGILDHGGGSFRGEETISRGELARLLYRYARSQGASTRCSGDLSDYWDGERVDEELVLPLSWAVESGVFAPLVSAELHPDYRVTRAQLAQVLTAVRALCTDDSRATAIYTAQKEAAVSKSRAQHQQIQAAVEKAAADHWTQGGIQVAVIEGGRITDCYAWGWADKTRPDGQMTARHKMRIASISKVAITMAAMSMAQDGEVDLDVSIGEYWGGTVKNRAYPNSPVSLRSIITHTSSIPMYGDDVSRQYEPVRSRLLSGDFSGIQPGSIWSWGYNNYAYGVLGMTLELVEGKVMDDILDGRFFDVLDIDGAFAAGEIDRTDLLCALYRNDGSTARTVEYQKTLRTDPTPAANGIFFAGGLVISGADMAKLTAVLANDGQFEGQRVLSPYWVETMETSIGTPAGLNYEQCQNIRLLKNVFGRDRIYYHSGSAYGVYNLMSYDPDTGDGVVVLTTGAVGSVDQNGIYTVCGQISRAVYDAIK